ncbi:AraC family transcriptional regulator [Niastella koreensis]|uniref:Transcriptional regulator, AraC family n=2 Tax=Niastella koreensis TaxID=354356 RepID=G8TRH1_NIAKG|nr:AraC family transcriptional regulator [Niastella koreensis]AEW01102.1 transcriptional regulator, AraC family [Niastella koreensis GR20-10]OQP41820.1 AraC family transcriptional regulator [Niastella koreensis]
MKHYKTINELTKTNGYPPSEHPLVGLLTCRELVACSIGESEFTSDFYIIALKKIKSGLFNYGRTRYDHDNGSMYFTRPRQVVEINNIETAEKAFVIMIHEDFFISHPLHEEIRKYGFFDYEINEALHLSANEEQIMWEIYRKIEREVNNNQDEYSRDIILAHVDSLLKYSQRFYKRQFINRVVLSGKLATRFTALLAGYFDQKLHLSQGLPTVKFMAAELNTSTRYLTDLLKEQTGKTALDHIHSFLIEEAKNMLRSTDNTVAETAYQLGFENPPYFSRLFKKETGVSPNQYREQFLN